MWSNYNPNPTARRNVGDCAVRAIAKALGISWEQAYMKLALNGFLMGDMPSSNSVIDSVLRESGLKKAIIPNECPKCYTAAQFLADNPKGLFVLGFGTHVATAINGILYDAWNSEDEIPVYTWYRDEAPIIKEEYLMASDNV